MGIQMSIFNLFNNTNLPDDSVYEEFLKWLDKHLINKLPDSIIAINFNIYEGADNTYHIEMIGSDEFDENDGDWACNELFTTREDMFYLQRTPDISEWEKGLKYVVTMVNKYLKIGKYSNRLKTYKAVGVGFVDGDIKIVYKS